MTESQLVQLLIKRVNAYETMMHDIQMYSCVTLDNPPIQHAIDVINCWSRAHRVGNGELSDQEQLEMVAVQFERIVTAEWRDSVRNSGISTKYS